MGIALFRHRPGRMIPVLLATLALCFATGLRSADAGPKTLAAAGPPAVVVAAIEIRPVEKAARYIGRIQAIASVDLRARVEGFLEQIAFEQGAMIEKGQPLYQIEQAPYQANLAAARGQLAAAKASLDSAWAGLENAEADFKRQETLLKKGDTSRTQYDEAKAKRDEAKANVEKAKAGSQQAGAAIQTAEIDLSYTKVSSPIAGRIGATSYTAGNLVGPSSGSLATVVQLDPIRARFSIPGKDYMKLVGQLSSEAGVPAGRYVPELILPTGETYGHSGTVAFIDNRIDPGTDTVAIYTDFPNPRQILLPGQYVTTVVHAADAERLPVVPPAAVQQTRDGEQVYVVGTDDRVQQRKIKTGRQVPGGLAVTAGLQAGELVIVQGIQKVKPGMRVTPHTEGGGSEKSGESDTRGSGGSPPSDGSGPATTGGDAS